MRSIATLIVSGPPPDRWSYEGITFPVEWSPRVVISICRRKKNEVLIFGWHVRTPQAFCFCDKMSC